MIIAIIPGFVQSQVVSGSTNTPSGYSIDMISGNLISNGSLTSGTGITTNTGSPTWAAYPSPQGSFGPDGYTFSYPTESLGWAGVSLSSINHGYLNSSAVFVTGFNYGVTYRFPCANSIGTNCDGTSQTAAPANPTQDNLRVEIGYYPATGSPTFITHQLGLKNINDGNNSYNPTWQTLAQTYTFAGAKPLSQAGAVNMEIIGSDAGGWACIGIDCYGPQVKNAYLRANYSVDPCILNPAYNPSCPGFQNVLQGSKSPAFYYSYNIAQSLPHIGGGVILHGYDYGFNWWNYGACYNTFLFWCTDWRTDGGGNINFRISDKNNATMLQQQWYVAGNNSGGGYSNRYLFTESRNSLDMGNIQWWTDSVWNHFGWSGWTRPIWTPDPCYTNGLYSPNCTNFKETLAKTIEDIKLQQEKIAALTPTISSTSTTPGGSVTITVSDAATTNPTVAVTTTTEQSSRSVTSTQLQNSQSLASSIISHNASVTNMAASVAQRAVNEASSVTSASSREAEQVAETLTNSSIAASIDTKESDQVIAGSIAVNRTVQTNVNAPAPVSIQTTQPANTQQRQEPQQQTSQLASITVESAAQLLVPNATFKSIDLVVNLPPTNNSARFIQEQPEFSFKAQEQTQPVSMPLVAAQSQTSYTAATTTTNLPQQLPITTIDVVAPVAYQPAISAAIEMEQPQQTRNFTTDRTNPINDIIEGRSQLAEQQTEQPATSSVNRSAQNNEAADGVDINNLAVIPVGFASYNIALKDVAFYQPKEIYRNQRTIDNRRALQNLRSDQLHQQMIDQQWR
jgi:hypothetical protein